MPVLPVFLRALRRGCFALGAVSLALPPVWWSAEGLLAAFWGRGPAFGPEALPLAAAACLLNAAVWLLPDCPGAADGKTKALLPDEWRGELCSSIVSNQS